MSNYFEHLTEQEKKLLRKTSFPRWVSPMLATLTNKRFSDPHWLYETKFDGVRALTFYQNGKVKILSRNKHLLNQTYPDLMQGFQRQVSTNFIVDGEIVAFENGITSFSRLQQRLGVKKISLDQALTVPVFYYLFDIIFLNGFDLRNLPLKRRKDILKKSIIFEDPLCFTEGIMKNGMRYYKEACHKGWEGIIAKRIEAPYADKRSSDWLKFKCNKSQELIIIGYTQPEGSREAFGALLVGYYQNNKLHYAGKVGTGFTRETLISLKQNMDSYIIATLPIDDQVREARQITWLKPVLVGEFEFTEWTKDGKLRHPRFKGLRYDKKANEVVREAPQ